MQPKHEHFERQLKIGLSDDEIAQRAQQAATLLTQRDQHELDAKAAASHAKAQIKELDSELRRVSGEVRDRATYRMISCTRVYNYDTGNVLVVRDDTGDLVEERPMSASERQVDLLPGDEPPPAKTRKPRKMPKPRK